MKEMDKKASEQSQSWRHIKLFLSLILSIGWGSGRFGSVRSIAKRETNERAFGDFFFTNECE